MHNIKHDLKKKNYVKLQYRLFLNITSISINFVLKYDFQKNVYKYIINDKRSTQLGRYVQYLLLPFFCCLAFDDVTENAREKPVVKGFS